MIAIEAIKDILDAHIRTLKNDNRTWDRLRALYRCEQMKRRDIEPSDTGTDADVVTESGALFAYTDSMVSSVVPPNPQITANPRNELLREPAKFREALVNDVLYRVKAHRNLWFGATLSAVYPRSFIKAVWNQRTATVDFINIDPRHVFFDMAAGKWEDIRYLVEATVLTRAEFESRTKKPNVRGKLRAYDPDVTRKARFGSYPQWLRRDTEVEQTVDRSLDVFRWVVVYEFWDFTEDVPKYYHYLEGQKEPLYAGEPPFLFLRNPFWMVKFNDNLEDIGGLADAALIESPVKRLDELRTIEMRFAQATIPVTTLNRAQVDDADMAKDKLTTCVSPGDILDLEVKDGAKLSDVIGQTPTAQLAPAFSTAKDGLQQEILFRLGMPQYTRGVTGTSDVATELALVDSSLRTRQGRRSEVINDCVWFMAKAIIALYEQFMAPDTTMTARLVSGPTAKLDRSSLMLRTVDEAYAIIRAGKWPEDPIEIDYEVVPYSPVENSKTAQLKKFAEFAKLLVGNQFVDQPKLFKRLTDLLDLGDLTPEGPPPGAVPPPGAQPGAQPLPGAQPSADAIQPQSADTIKGGGLPQGIEKPPGVPTTAMAGMAGGPGKGISNGLRQ